MRLSLLIIFIVSLWFFSCHKKDEELTFDGAASLEFSADTVTFDTIFSDLGSATKRFKVYNRSSNAVMITSINLQGGVMSEYELIINGQETPSVESIKLRGGDSLYVLVKVTIDPQNLANPYLVMDKVVFVTNGNTQRVVLVAYGQDAHFHDGETITCGTTWTDDKPHVIYNSLTIPVGCTLTIDPGVRVYSHNESLIHIYGTLLVNGTETDLVTFTSDKLDNSFANTPGQWGGIMVHSGSKNNRISFAHIRNGETGIRMLAETDADTIAELALDHVRIENMSVSGIAAQQTDLHLSNVLMYNAADYLFAGTGGGNYYLNHCTLGDYSFDFARLLPAVYFSNSTALTVRIKNSILWGDRTSVINWSDDGTNPFDLRIDSSTVKTNLSFTGNDNLNVDPQFVAYYYRNFHLQATSPAIGQAAVTAVTDDLEGKPRDASPDMGAFEY